MITEAKVPNYPTVAESFKLLLGSVLEWLISNPPYTVGILLVLAAVLWYFLHIRPDKRREKRAAEQAIQDAERQAREAYLTQKQQEDAAKQEKQEYWDKKHQAEATQKAAADEAARLAKEKRKLDEQAARQKAGRDFELRIIELLETRLTSWLETGRAKLLYNLTLPMNGYNTQIDAVLVDTSGIYVIECKCWDRLIVGMHNWPCWFAIKVIFKNSIPVTSENDQSFYCQAFKSPIVQNEEHKNSLSAFLQQKTNHRFKQFKRITVFDTCGKTSFILPSQGRPDPYIDPYTWVGKRDDLLAEIQEFDESIHINLRLSIPDVNLIFNALKPYAESFTGMTPEDNHPCADFSSSLNERSQDFMMTATPIDEDEEEFRKRREQEAVEL